MSDRIRHEGTWLRFCERAFQNTHGETKTWEYVSRRQTVGAVCILPIRPGPEPQVVLVEQYRPPLGGRILEFPAGLIDEDDSVDATALRELEEETGCHGRVLDTGPFVYNSPGLTDESVCVVTVEVTGQADTRHEPDEHIEVVELPLRGLKKALETRAAAGIHIDAKLWYYAQGLEARESQT